MPSCTAKRQEGIVRRSDIVKHIAVGTLALTLLVAGDSAATTIGQRTVHPRAHTARATDSASHIATKVAPSPSGVLRDSSLIMGTLPNGLRYYLRANHAPAHRVELRLAVNAGSVLEDKDQQGFAHFLEHMAFNGTTHFPHNTLEDFIETAGMRFGADLNAFTSQDETVYLLTLPSDDATILSQGLDVIQDWAGGGILIDSSEVLAERGVVMGEWRTRLQDTVSQRVKAHFDTLYVGGSPYLNREPIGDTTLLENAQPSPIRRFYHDWYRTDLMAVVVVGDFDPVAMQREIVRRFGAIPAAKNPRHRFTPALRSVPGTLVSSYLGPISPTVEVVWPVPPTPSDPRAALRQQIVQELLTDELQKQLLGIGTRPSRPYIVTQLEQGRIVRPFNVRGFQLVAWPDSLERGLATVVGECERIARTGIPAATLERRKAVLLQQYEHAAASERALTSGAYADTYVQHFLTADVSLLSATQELALARPILQEITPQVLAEAARFWRQSAGRRVMINIPEFAHVPAPSKERVLALFDSVQHAPISPLIDSVAASAGGPLLATAPKPGTIVHESVDSVAGITEWTLSNGARVLVKPSQNDPDQLLLNAWGPGGFSTMPDSIFFTPGRMVARLMTDVTNVGSFGRGASSDKLALSGIRSFNANIGYTDQSMTVEGTPKSLETLFQLIHLQFTAPTLDSATLASWQSLAKYQSAGFSFDDQLNQELAHGNPRMQPVQTSLAELASERQLLAAHHDRFGNASNFTFTVVGAISPAEVTPFVERYIASLPSTGQRETPRGEDVKPFLHRVNRIVNALPLPKAQTVLIFDGPFTTKPDEYLRERQRLSALATVFQDRLRTRVREQLSGSYSPAVLSETLAMPDEHFRVIAGFDAAPERMHQLNIALTHLVDSLRKHGVTEAEATRVATVQRRQLETRLQSNAYWAQTMILYGRLGIPLDRIPSPFPEREVSAQQIQAAAQRYLPDDVYMHLTLMPQDSTSYAQGDSTLTH
jgi:zinc protease